MILYPIILVRFGFVFVQAFRGKVPRRVALPFVINLVANLVFTPIQFGLRNLPLAADIFIVWATIIWCVVAVWPHARIRDANTFGRGPRPRSPTSRTNSLAPDDETFVTQHRAAMQS